MGRFAELAVLAMTMFLLAFFVMKLLFIPAELSIESMQRVHEVQETTQTGK